MAYDIFLLSHGFVNASDLELSELYGIHLKVKKSAKDGWERFAKATNATSKKPPKKYVEKVPFFYNAMPA